MSLDIESAKRDLVVAAAAAATAVLVTVVTEVVLGLGVSILLRAVPLYVYFLYRFTRKGGPYASIDTHRTWAVLAAVSGLAIVAYGLL
ncbi:hypothetical protein RYH80_00235 [Halobaculum sp. MBLA0147]|uniref:hypothetical protein n=1 Tax=Halobaculum sp. MBLA0147 TaxID=3079934 RepID=UPI00352642C1